MKTYNWIRKQIEKYLRHPRAISQNELERRVGFGKGSIAKFLKGRNLRIGQEKYRKLIDIIAPWEYDVEVVAGSIRGRLLRQRWSIKDIAIIASIVAGTGGKDESIGL